MGRANLLDFCGLEGMVRHGRTKVLAVLAQIFFSLRFLESCSDNYLQNNLKKTIKKRLNAWVASHEALV